MRLAAMLMVGVCVSACSGGGGAPISGYEATSTIPPQEAIRATGGSRRDISWRGRQDYKEAMVADCEAEGGYFAICSTLGTGWFNEWPVMPELVVIPDDSTVDEALVILRAVGIVNRVLPADKRLRTEYANAEFKSAADEAIRQVSERVAPDMGRWEPAIYADIRNIESTDAQGVAWTNGEFGYALVQESLMEHGQEYAVQTMVHEMLHAVGLMGHPHHAHTSVLSYQHQSSRVFDNVPLVDAAVLFDMYGWGDWTGRVDTVFNWSEGVQFGVHRVWHTYGLRSVEIPWVDGGFMPPPPESALRGTATWSGGLVGYTSGLAVVYGEANLTFDFGTSWGSAEFHTIRNWDGGMWNRAGWSYDLFVNGTYFDSVDEDAISDVVGAFYGLEAEVAAGTLQRPEITAAFGAERNRGSRSGI